MKRKETTMMMMKRLLAGILAGATVLGLAACGSTAKQPDKSFVPGH